MTVTHLPEVVITDSSKPVRPGIYKRRVFVHGFITYSRWDGTRWLTGVPIRVETDEGHAQAFRDALQEDQPTHFQTCLYWWGLAEEPKA